MQRKRRAVTPQTESQKSSLFIFRRISRISMTLLVMMQAANVISIGKKAAARSRALV